MEILKKFSVGKMADKLSKPSALKIIGAIAMTAYSLVCGVMNAEAGAVKKKVKAPEGMVYVPGGCFQMGTADGQPGDDDERPRHKHCLKNGYFIDKYEFTVAEYKKLVDAGKVREPMWVSPNPDANYPDKLNHPVNVVDWGQADAACKAVGKRLPTVAEWEGAARGTDGRKYPWGNEEPVDGVHANFGHPYADKSETVPVGSYEKGKSPYGAYDMAGNVKELTADWYGPKYNYQKAKQGHIQPKSGPGVVLKGGSFTFANAEVDPVGNADPAYRLRPAATDGIEKRYGASEIGFRCVKDEETINTTSKKMESPNWKQMQDAQRLKTRQVLKKHSKGH